MSSFIKITIVAVALFTTVWIAWDSAAGRRAEDALQRLQGLGAPPGPEVVGADAARAAERWMELAREVDARAFDEDAPASEELVRFEDLIVRARELAAGVHPRFPFEGVEDSIQLLYLGKVLEASARAGRADDLAAMVRLCDGLRSSGWLINQMVRVAVADRVASVAAEAVMSGSNIDGLDAMLVDVRPVAALDLGLRGDVSYVTGELDLDSTADVYLDLIRFSGYEIRWFHAPIAKLVQPWLKSGIADHIEYLADAREALRLPVSEAVPRLESMAMTAKQGHSLVRAVVVNMGPMFKKQKTVSARLELARLGLRASEYRRDTGRFPSAPGDLGAERPTDPLTGEDFVLSMDGDALVLQSSADGEVTLRLTTS